MRVLFLVLLILTGCASHVSKQVGVCPPPVREPINPPKHATQKQVNKFEIQVELLREQERDRANACAQALYNIQKGMQ